MMKKLSHGRCLYVVEGDIEKRFIEQIKQADLIVPGRVQVFNLMQKEIREKDSILNKKVSSVFCIIDTDRKEVDNLQKLTHNVKKLRQIGADVVVLVQKENFEGELGYVLEEEGIRSLCRLFSVKHETLGDLKTFLSQQVQYEGYVNQDNVKRYCARTDEFVGIVSRAFDTLGNHIKMGKDSIAR